jgi:hypothetical protein
MKQETREIADKVRDVLYERNPHSYHYWYSYGDIEEYDSYASFEVYVHSDKWEGDDWTEDWCVYDDGSICSPDKVWKNIDEFLTYWL